MIRHVNITIITLDGKRLRRRIHAGPRKRITSDGVTNILESEAELMEKHFPGRAFRLVPLQGAAFNLVEVPVPQTEGASV
jgi:hypothetical protein